MLDFLGVLDTGILALEEERRSVFRNLILGAEGENATAVVGTSAERVETLLLVVLNAGASPDGMGTSTPRL